MRSGLFCSIEPVEPVSLLGPSFGYTSVFEYLPLIIGYSDLKSLNRLNRPNGLNRPN